MVFLTLRGGPAARRRSTARTGTRRRASPPWRHRSWCSRRSRWSWDSSAPGSPRGSRRGAGGAGALALGGRPADRRSGSSPRASRWRGSSSAARGAARHRVRGADAGPARLLRQQLVPRPPLRGDRRALRPAPSRAGALERPDGAGRRLRRRRRRRPWTVAGCWRMAAERLRADVPRGGARRHGGARGLAAGRRGACRDRRRRCSPSWCSARSPACSAILAHSRAG